MAKTDGTNRLQRQYAIGIDVLVKKYIRQYGLSSGINTHCVLEAWDKVSGAGAYTLNKFFKSGVLYCTISSSLVRNQLYFQRDVLLKQINEELTSAVFFTGKAEGYVKNIVLK